MTARFRCTLLLAFLAIGINSRAEAVEQATASDGYPDRPISIVVHSKPGSGIDITARQFTRIAARYSDAVFIVENRPGGSGSVAMQSVAGRDPDGYHVLAVTKSFVSTMLLAKSGITTDDFTWFAGMVVDPEVLITNRHADVTTLDDIIRDANRQGGTQLWVGPLVGGVDHLTAVKVWERLGIQGIWIPYEGGADALTALLGRLGTVYVGNPVDVRGRPDLMIAAVASDERLDQFPDVPTFAEKGYDITSEVLWRGFAVRAGTEPGRVEFLEDLFGKVSRDSSWVDFVVSSSAYPLFLDTEQFTATVRRDQEEARTYLELAGVLGDDRAPLPVGEGLAALIFLLSFFAALAVVYRFRRGWVQGDTVIAAALTFLVGYMYYLTFAFPVGKLARTVGPATMPRVLIYAMAACCLWLMVARFRDPEQQPVPEDRRVSSPLFLVLLTGAYLSAIPYAGYYLGTFLFLLAGMALLKFRRPVLGGIAAGGFVAFSWLAIYKVLQVPLPVGKFFE
jgi:tripartite-type tricarboxylate transporter receptor subunit TctC